MGTDQWSLCHCTVCRAHCWSEKAAESSVASATPTITLLVPVPSLSLSCAASKVNRARYMNFFSLFLFTERKNNEGVLSLLLKAFFPFDILKA